MKSSTSFRLVFVVALGATLLACAKREPDSQASMEAASAPAAAEVRLPEARLSAGGAVADALRKDQAATDPSQLTSSAATYTDAQRKFIRTAQANFRVKDVYQAALAIELWLSASPSRSVLMAAAEAELARRGQR